MDEKLSPHGEGFFYNKLKWLKKLNLPTIGW